MSKQDFHYRFAVGNPRYRRSSIWRVWTSKSPKSDIFIAARNLAGTLKMSLHESGIWRAAFTAEYAAKYLKDSIPPSKARRLEEWKRPPDIAPGVTLAFRIIIPNQDLEVIPIDANLSSKEIN